MQEWYEDLAKDAAEGGMMATPQGLQEFLLAPRFLDKVYDPSPKLVAEGQADLKTIKRGFYKFKRRRAAPEWSLPNEVWAVLLSRRKRTMARAPGLGLPQPCPTEGTACGSGRCQWAPGVCAFADWGYCVCRSGGVCYRAQELHRYCCQAVV